MDVRLPDGTVIRNIPEGTTQSELASRLTKGGYKVPPEWTTGAKPAAGGAPPAATPRSAPAASSGPPDTGATFPAPLYSAGAVSGLRPKPEDVQALGSPFETLGHKAGEKTLQLTGSPGLATVADVGLGSAVPMLLGGGTGAAIGAPPVRGVARWAMEKAIRPEDILSGDAATAIDAMLKRGLNVSREGFKSLRSEVAKLGKEIDSIIAYSSKTVGKASVRKSLRAAFDQFKGRTDEAERAQDINEAWNKFVNSPAIQGAKDIPIQRAMLSKRAISNELKESAYGQPVQGQAGTAAAREAALKSTQSGLRKEIGAQEPAIEKPLRQQHEALTAMDQIEKRIIMEARKNPMGLSSFAVHHPQEFAMFMMDRSSAFKSAIANMLFRNQRAIPLGAGAGATGVGNALQVPPFQLPTFSMYGAQQR